MPQPADAQALARPADADAEAIPANVPVRRIAHRGPEEAVEVVRPDGAGAEPEFVLVNHRPDRDAAAPPPAPHRLTVASKLFDVLTTLSPYDHPLCEEARHGRRRQRERCSAVAHGRRAALRACWRRQCNQRLQDDIKEAIKEADAEHAAYEQFLASDAAASLDEAAIERMDAEIAQVRRV